MPRRQGAALQRLQHRLRANGAPHQGASKLITSAQSSRMRHARRALPLIAPARWAHSGDAPARSVPSPIRQTSENTPAPRTQNRPRRLGAVRPGARQECPLTESSSG